MTERLTPREGSQGRGAIIIASLAAALVLTFLVCVLAFAVSAARAAAATAQEAADPPPQPPTAAPPESSPGDVDEDEDGEDDSEEGAAESPDASGERITQLVAKDYMVRKDSTAEGDRVLAPVTFIVCASRVITVRYHNPRPFETFPEIAGRGL